MAALGLVSAGIYWFGWVALVPLLPNLNTPLLDLGKITSYSMEAAVQFSASLIALFGLYALGYRLCGGKLNRARAAIVILFPLGFAALLAAAYPATAADVFDYIMQARILTRYLANPLVTTPSFFSNDPFYPYAVWSDMPSIYGPLWTILSIFPSLLGGDDLLASVLAFKGTAIAFYLADAALIYAVLERTAPAEKWRGLYLFAWNPLVLWETAANAHNDVAMMFFVLLAFLAMARRRVALALPAIALAAVVKYVTALLGPLMIAHVLRESGPRLRCLQLLEGALAGLFLVVAFYFPFWDGWDTLEPLGRRSGFLTASPAALLSLALERISGVTPPAVLISLIAAAAFGALYLREISRPDLGRVNLAASSYRIIFYYLVLASLWFQAWYLIWLVALAALAGDGFYQKLSILFSFTAMASYIVFIYVWMRYPDWFGVPQVQTLAVAVIFAAPVLWWMAEWWQGRARPVPRIDTARGTTL